MNRNASRSTIGLQQLLTAFSQQFYCECAWEAATEILDRIASEGVCPRLLLNTICYSWYGAETAAWWACLFIKGATFHDH